MKLLEFMAKISALRLFLVVATIVLVAHSVTLSFSSQVWADAVQICEVGRTGLLEKHPAWSLYIHQNGESARTLFYVGCLIQEIACRFLGYLGPWFFSMFGLILASFFLFKYLIEKTGNEYLSLGVSLLLIVDPNVTQGVRASRVDYWAIACVFASILLLARIEEPRNARRETATFCLTGCLSAFSMFVWPSVVLALPLVIVEFFDYCKRCKWSTNRIFIGGSIAFIAALFTMITLLFPIRNFLHLAFGQISSDSAAIHVAFSFFKSYACFITLMLQSPFICIIGMLSLFVCKKNWRYLAVFMPCLLFMLSAYLHKNRFVYIYPYFLIGMAIWLSQPIFMSNWLLCLIKRPFLCVALLCGFGYSVVLRNSFEVLMSGSRSHTQLLETVREEIGVGPIKIYTDTYQTYYVGRTLGWLQYRQFSHNYNDWQRPDRNIIDVLLEDVDYFLGDQSVLPAEVKNRLSWHGFVYVKTISVPSKTDQRILEFIGKHKRIIGYGPYVLYKKIQH